jgi:hypothetical protein
MTIQELEQKKQRLSKEDLLDLIRHQVIKSRELAEGNGGYNIRRGMAHAIPGYCEDVFALYIAKHVGRKDLKYFVDKVITLRFNEGEKAKSFKPDLAIINEHNQLTHYFDVKTNLGWNRYLKEYLNEKNQFVKDLIAHNKAWINKKREWDDFETLPITISPDLKYHMVVVFGGNMKEKDMIQNHQIANGLDYVTMDLLKPNEHINQDAFESIHQSLQNLKTLK